MSGQCPTLSECPSLPFDTVIPTIDIPRNAQSPLVGILLERCSPERTGRRGRSKGTRRRINRRAPDDHRLGEVQDWTLWLL